MAVTDKPWDGSASRFTDSQYEASCVLDRKSCGGDWASKPPKQRCSLPIKEPDGTLNSNGVKAAAQRLPSVTDACPGAIASAKAALRTAHKTIGHPAPSSIADTDQKKSSEEYAQWGVREGVPRHGEVAIRMSAESEWELRSNDQGEGLGVLTGHFAVFDRWTEINNFFEGRFMESMAPGAFTKTFDENRKGMRVLLNHGRDPSVGNKPLGPIRELDQDSTGARYEVDLLDTSYNRDIVPGLKAGQYGASFRFQVVREEVNTDPGRSGHNPDGIEERVIKEAMVREFGPVTFPAYADATAGMRSLNEELFDLDMGFRSLDPRAAASFLNHLRTGEAEHPNSSVNGETPADRSTAAPSTDAPETKTTSVYAPRRRFSTLKSGAAGTIRTSRTDPEEDPKWKL